MAALNPGHLLDQADRLTTSHRGGAPRQADLRRAISNSYYALFHAILTQAADAAVGRRNRAEPRYSLAYRCTSHTGLRRLCDDLTRKTLPKKYERYVPAGGFGPPVVDVANAVVELQEKRHLADYDPLYRANRSDATLAIQTSRRALQRFGRASRVSKQAFVSLLLFPPR